MVDGNVNDGENLFSPLGLRVSVIACMMLKYWMITTDTPVSEVSVVFRL